MVFFWIGLVLHIDIESWFYEFLLWWTFYFDLLTTRYLTSELLNNDFSSENDICYGLLFGYSSKIWTFSKTCEVIWTCVILLFDSNSLWLTKSLCWNFSYCCHIMCILAATFCCHLVYFGGWVLMFGIEIYCCPILQVIDVLKD